MQIILLLIQTRCQALERTHKVDSISTVTKVVEMTARKNYQTVKQGGFETLTQFIEKFRVYTRHTLRMVEQQFTSSCTAGL